MVSELTQTSENQRKPHSEEDQWDHASDQKGFDSWCDGCQKQKRLKLLAPGLPLTCTQSICDRHVCDKEALDERSRRNSAMKRATEQNRYQQMENPTARPLDRVEDVRVPSCGRKIENNSKSTSRRQQHQNRCTCTFLQSQSLLHPHWLMGVW
jgi:hypothetical protein